MILNKWKNAGSLLQFNNQLPKYHQGPIYGFQIIASQFIFHEFLRTKNPFHLNENDSIGKRITLPKDRLILRQSIIKHSFYYKEFEDRNSVSHFLQHVIGEILT